MTSKLKRELQKQGIMKFNQFKLLGLLLMFLATNAVYAGFFEEKKEIRCAYKVEASPSVELNNQYGEVQIVSWDKDSVKVEATITATSDRLDDITKLLNRVEVICRGTKSTVVISTEWAEGVSIFKKGSMDLKNILKSDKKLKVDYKVYLPIDSRLSITNRFGDIYLPNYEGPLRVELSHGDLRARDIKDGRSISVRYGKMLIKNLDQGLLKLEYGSLILDRANILTVESKSSTIEILEANRLAIKSRSDEFRLDQVKSLRGQSTYTNILVKELKELISLVTSYGDLRIRSVANDFKNVQLTGHSTDYDLEFGAESNFQLLVETIKEKGLTHSPLITLKTDGSVINDGRKYFGFLGAENASAKVRIVQKSGYLNLYVK